MTTARVSALLARSSGPRTNAALTSAGAVTISPVAVAAMVATIHLINLVVVRHAATRAA